MRRAVVLTLLALLCLAGRADAAALVRVKANTAVRGDRLPRSFLGVSQEYQLIEKFTGTSAGGVNTATAALMRRLGEYGGGPPVLRIGGGSADSTWWNPENKSPPPGLQIAASPRMLLGMTEFARASNSLLLPALNFGYPDHSVLYEEAANFAQGIPPELLYAWELGNEPDYYPRRKLHSNEDGSVTYNRDQDYGPSQYQDEVSQVLPQLLTLTGSTPVAGPATSLVQSWVKSLPSLLRGSGKKLGLVSLHAYELNACATNSAPVTAQQLVSHYFLGRLFAALSVAMKSARAAHRPVRVTEANSASCGGVDGVSNAQAASLWTVDYLFGLWLVGTNGVNLHASSQLYRPFGFARYDNGYLAGVGAPYYGMLAFAEATRNRARLLPSVVFGSRVRGQRNVSTWGTVDVHRRIVKVVVINKEEKATGSAVVRVPHAYSQGTVKRLTAPSLTAKEGIRWAGQYFEAPTDGTIAGTPQERTVRRRGRGKFIFSVPPASAALFTIKVSRLARRHK